MHDARAATHWQRLRLPPAGIGAPAAAACCRSTALAAPMGKETERKQRGTGQGECAMAQERRQRVWWVVPQSTQGNIRTSSTSGRPGGGGGGGRGPLTVSG